MRRTGRCCKAQRKLNQPGWSYFLLFTLQQGDNIGPPWRWWSRWIQGAAVMSTHTPDFRDPFPRGLSQPPLCRGFLLIWGYLLLIHIRFPDPCELGQCPFTVNRVKHKRALDCQEETKTQRCLLGTDISRYFSPTLTDNSWNLWSLLMLYKFPGFTFSALFHVSGWFLSCAQICDMSYKKSFLKLHPKRWTGYVQKSFLLQTVCHTCKGYVTFWWRKIAQGACAIPTWPCSCTQEFHVATYCTFVSWVLIHARIDRFHFNGYCSGQCNWNCTKQVKTYLLHLHCIQNRLSERIGNMSDTLFSLLDVTPHF